MTHEDSLKKKLGESAFEEKVAKTQARFSGLLTREGSIKLLALDHGLEQEKKISPVPVKLSQLKDFEGEFVTVIARVKKIFCSREFERDGRAGRVCNVLLGDETGEATIVLWNSDADFAERKLERNSCVKAENVSVKNGELQTSLYASLSLSTASEGLPDYSVQPAKLSAAAEGGDFYARVVGKSALREFERDGRKGMVLNLTVEDDSGSRTLVCWNRNAQVADCLDEGDVVKAEGVTLKNGELQASWMTHLIAHAKNHSLPELEFQPFSSISSGESAFVQATLARFFEARVSRKCVSCGAQVGESKEKCDCGGSVREVLLVTAQGADSTDPKQSARMVFFGEQAREILGLKRTLLSPELVFDLKREFLEGKTLKIKVLAKKRNDGTLELVVKQIRSHL